MTGQRYCESFPLIHQNSLFLIKKRRRGATHTEAKGSVDDLCGGTEKTPNNGIERKVYVIYFVVGAVYLLMNSDKCWLMTTKSSDLRFGWKSTKPLEEEDGVSSGVDDSDDEKAGDHPDGRFQPGVQMLHRQGAPWKVDVSRECRYEFFSISPAVCEERGCPGPFPFQPATDV